MALASERPYAERSEAVNRAVERSETLGEAVLRANDLGEVAHGLLSGREKLSGEAEKSCEGGGGKLGSGRRKL